MQDWEIVETTADIIEKRGFCTGALVNGEGRVCVDGALAYALRIPEIDELEAYEKGERPRNDDYWDSFSNSVYVAPELVRMAARIVKALDLEPVQPDPTVSLYQWNDIYAYCESAEDNKQRVLDGLRKAAKVIRQQDEV